MHPLVRHVLSGTLLLCLAAAGVGPALAADRPAAPAPGVREVVIAFKTHFDIGYTDMAATIVQRYRTTRAAYTHDPRRR